MHPVGAKQSAVNHADREWLLHCIHSHSRQIPHGGSAVGLLHFVSGEALPFALLKLDNDRVNGDVAKVPLCRRFGGQHRNAVFCGCKIEVVWIEEFCNHCSAFGFFAATEPNTSKDDRCIQM